MNVKRTIFGMTAVGAILFGGVQIASGQADRNEDSGGPSPRAIVDEVALELDGELASYVVTTREGSSPGESCVFLTQGSAGGGGGICFIDWDPKGWDEPQVMSAPVAGQENLESPDRLVMLVISSPGAPVIVGSFTRDGQLMGTDDLAAPVGRTDVGGAAVDIRVFSADAAEWTPTKSDDAPPRRVVYR